MYVHVIYTHICIHPYIPVYIVRPNLFPLFMEKVVSLTEDHPEQVSLAAGKFFPPNAGPGSAH